MDWFLYENDLRHERVKHNAESQFIWKSPKLGQAIRFFSFDSTFKHTYFEIELCFIIVTIGIMIMC